jgi:hypothetical protein
MLYSEAQLARLDTRQRVGELPDPQKAHKQKLPNEAIFGANPNKRRSLVPTGHEPAEPNQPKPAVPRRLEPPPAPSPPLRISHSFRTRSPRHCIH